MVSRDSNILVVSPEYGYGGIGRHTRTVVNFLTEYGFKVTIHANKGTLLKNITIPSVQIKEITRPILGFSLFNPFFDILSSAQIDRDVKPSLIIRTLPPFYPYIPQVRNEGIPELAISHAVLPAFGVVKGQGKMDIKDKLTLSNLGIIIRQSEKKMLQKASRVVAVSNYTKSSIAEYYMINEDKIRVIYNFVDSDRFNKKHPEDIKSEIGQKVKKFKGDSLLAIFVAQLPAGAAKNFDLFFSIMVSASKMGIKFIIVGMSSTDVYATTYAPKIRRDSALFLGYINNSFLPELYSLSDFIIIPSLYENLPTVLLEAMACGVIPISTRVGGIPEAIDENVNGFLLPAKKQAFLEVLERLCNFDNYTLDQMSKKAQVTIKNKFDVKVVKEKYLELIDEIITK